MFIRFTRRSGDWVSIHIKTVHKDIPVLQRRKKNVTVPLLAPNSLKYI